jgi:hypothetical protein
VTTDPQLGAMVRRRRSSTRRRDEMDAVVRFGHAHIGHSWPYLARTIGYSWSFLAHIHLGYSWSYLARRIG